MQESKRVPATLTSGEPRGLRATPLLTARSARAAHVKAIERKHNKDTLVYKAARAYFRQRYFHHFHVVLNESSPMGNERCSAAVACMESLNASATGAAVPDGRPRMEHATLHVLNNTDSSATLDVLTNTDSSKGLNPASATSPTTYFRSVAEAQDLCMRRCYSVP